MRKGQRIRPVGCIWNGEHFVPLPRFQRLCDQQFTVHEEYALIPHEERSMTQHRAYFAAIKEGWQNLAEEFDGRFPSAEHLRAWALVKTGFCTHSDFVMGSPTDARKLGRELRRMDPYSIISIKMNVVQLFEPESQSVQAMKRERFEASCKAVLDLVASMARSTPAQLRKNAGRAA